MNNPGQWARLRNGQVDIATAVEEVLRYTSPALHVMRVSKRDVLIGGERVRAGDRVAVWNGSANRDALAFPDPDRFDLGRTPNRHLTFGIGPHFCVGAPLARVELRVLLQVLAEKVGEMELAGPMRRLKSNFMWGIESLPVVLRAR